MRIARPYLVVLLLAAILAAAHPVGAAPASLDAKRREAARLQQQIQAQGRRLALAAEDFDQARLEREKLDGRLARTRRDLRLAEERWNVLKGRLARRVRFLYMHPGVWASTVLDAQNFGSLARGRVLAGSVLMMDTDLLMQTEKARAQIQAAKRQMEGLRADARDKEKSLSAKRQAVEKELRVQQALLKGVQGEIAQILEAERRRQLEEAARRAAAEAARRKRSPGLAAPTGPPPAVRATAAKAVQTAREQIGKPYQWGAAGPGSFDCSGLTMYAWAAAGVDLPHSSRSQYSSLPKVRMDDLQPGDLVFYGSPIHHVGIYEGGGVMINAPESGESVRRNSIYRGDFTGAARP